MGRTLLSLLILAGLTAPAAAEAAFPGQNGKIAFQGGGVDPEIYTVDPDGSDLTRLTTSTGTAIASVRKGSQAPLDSAPPSYDSFGS